MSCCSHRPWRHPGVCTQRAQGKLRAPLGAHDKHVEGKLQTGQQRMGTAVQQQQLQGWAQQQDASLRGHIAMPN